MGGVVGVLDGLVDAAAVGDLVFVFLGPGPDLRGSGSPFSARLPVLRVPPIRVVLRPVAV